MRLVAFFDRADEEISGRQFQCGQGQSGCGWIFENKFLQVLLHLGKNLLQIQMPISEMQKQI